MMPPRPFLLGALAVTVAAIWWVTSQMEDRHVREQRRGIAQRAARVASFAAQTPPADAVVFLGSSTIEFWPLDRSFPGSKAINRGIGAEPLGELMARLPRSLPEDLAGAVVYAGSVDFNTLGRPAKEVAQATARLLDEIRRLRPGLPLVLIGVNPARDTPSDRVSSLAHLNALNRTHCEQARPPVAFVDTDGAPFRNARGTLSKEASRDRWHLNDQGYEALAAQVQAAAETVGIKLSP